MTPLEIVEIATLVPIAAKGVVSHLTLTSRFLSIATGKGERIQFDARTQTLSHTSTTSKEWLVFTSLCEKTKDYNVQDGLYTESSVTFAALGLFPMNEKSKFQRPIVESDLPIIEAWAKAAGVKEPLTVEYVPQQTKAFSPS